MFPSFLNVCSTDFYLEALLRQIPVDFESDDGLRRLATSANHVVILWTTDRDINNAVVMQWFFNRLGVDTLCNIFLACRACRV